MPLPDPCHFSDFTEITAPDLADFEVGYLSAGGSESNRRLRNRLLLGLGGFTPGHRLTLTSGTPVTTSDVTGAGTLYYTPWLHNLVRLWDGSAWRLFAQSEVSLALTLTSGKNYDVFLKYNAGTPILALSAAWTNDTTRADALGTQDNVTVLSSDHTYLWVGTIRASGTNTTEDSCVKRFVWNAQNRVARKLKRVESTSSWTYNSTTWRQANAASANKVEVVIGQAGDPVDLTASIFGSATTSAGGYLDIGVDWSSGAGTADVQAPLGTGLESGTTGEDTLLARLIDSPAAGYHSYTWLESTSGATVTFYGGTNRQYTGISGLVGTLLA